MSTTRALMRRILEEPKLAAAVQALEPRALGKLIEHVGLEDAGELVALATTAQLEEIFDEDLWKSQRPGVDETFDAERFGVWLEILLEVGEAFAARKLAELPEDQVMMALSRQVLVIDLDALSVEMADGPEEPDDLLDKALDSALHVEIDRFRVIARRPEGSDALVAVLLALDSVDRTFLEGILERLAVAAEREIDEGGGLYNVLTAAETLVTDAAGAREDRRSRAGFIAPSQAAAFLKMARRDGASGAERDPVTRAYFRELDVAPRPSQAPETPLAGILRDAGLVDTPAPLLLTGAVSPLRGALADLDPIEQGRRAEELAYLAVVVVAGFDGLGRALRPIEAADVVLAVCERGFALLGEVHSADRLFRAGWNDIADPKAFVAALVRR